MEIGYPTQHCNFMDFKYLTVFINFYWSYTVSLFFVTGNIGVSGSVFWASKTFS